MHQPPELLTLKMIRKYYVPLGERTLFRMIAGNEFPKPDVVKGNKIRLWRRSTVQGWIEQNAEAR